MAKYFKNQQCVHCGVYHNTLTSDHVFPKSWYPITTPDKLEKWQIPACEKCNNDYSKIEEDLLIRIGLCIDANDYASLGIADKVLRSLKPEYARSNKDRRIRQAKKDKVLRELLTGNQIPEKGFFPNFDKHNPKLLEPKAAVQIPLKSIEKLAEKIVRGITYLESKSIIQAPYFINTFVLHDNDAKEYVSIVNKYGKLYSREPGISVVRAPIEGDKILALYSIDIWSRFKLYVVVGDKTIHPFA